MLPSNEFPIWSIVFLTTLCLHTLFVAKNKHTSGGKSLDSFYSPVWGFRGEWRMDDWMILVLDMSKMRPVVSSDESS